MVEKRVCARTVGVQAFVCTREIKIIAQSAMDANTVSGCFNLYGNIDMKSASFIHLRQYDFL
jgi:hypothetical protein